MIPDSILDDLQNPAFIKRMMIKSLVGLTGKMEELNRQQLEAGVNAQGEPTPQYRSSWGRRKGKANWDLRDKGNFYKSIKYEVVAGKYLEVDCDGHLLDDVLIPMAGYDFDPLGLTDDSLEALQDPWLEAFMLDLQQQLS